MGTSNIAIYVIVFLAVFAPYAFLQLCLGARKPTPDDIDSWNLPPLFRKFYWLTSMMADSVGAKMAELLGKIPLLDLGMRLGEGSGAALAMPLLDAASAVMNRVATFEAAGVTTEGIRL